MPTIARICSGRGRAQGRLHRLDGGRKALMQRCADHVKVSSELGGNAPFIVLGDVDLEIAAA